MRRLALVAILTIPIVAACATPRATPAVQAADEGLAQLECVITELGALGPCKVLSERPAGHGFGQAALDIMSSNAQVRLPAGTERGNVRFSAVFAKDQSGAIRAVVRGQAPPLDQAASNR